MYAWMLFGPGATAAGSAARTPPSPDQVHPVARRYESRHSRPSVPSTKTSRLPEAADTADGDRPWEIGHLSGPPSYVVDVLERYRHHGVTEVLLGFGGGADRRRRQLETLLAHGLPMAAG